MNEDIFGCTDEPDYWALYRQGYKPGAASQDNGTEPDRTKEDTE